MRKCYCCGSSETCRNKEGWGYWYLNHDREENALCNRCFEHFIKHEGRTGRPYKRGQRIKDSNGYVMIKCLGHPRTDKKGYVKEHVLVMEKVLGRHLSISEEVDHINKDPLDNRPENLRLFTSRAEHMKYHRLIEVQQGKRLFRAQEMRL